MARWRLLAATLTVVGLIFLTVPGDARATGGLAPIVFVPGKAGNQLEAKLDKASTKHPHCPTHKDWYRIWMDVWQMLPGDIECWSENLFLHYNTSTGQSYNTPGVSIRVPGWGTTESVEYVDPSWTAWVLGDVGAYANQFIKELVKFGYRRGKNLHAAPYDFRLAPSSQPRYHADLKQLIEETHRHNGGERVLLVGHSNGGLMLLYFLNQQSDEWKATYVKAFVSLATPYSGAPILTLMYTSGYNWGIEAVNALIIREQQRSYETSAFLLPRGPVYDRDTVIIRTPDRNYTAYDYDRYFRDIDYELGGVILDNVLDSFLPKLTHPGVDSYCFYSNGQETMYTLVYEDGEFPDTIPSFLWGDGDGTVPIKSLRSCETFLRPPGTQQKLTAVEVDNADHTSLTYHPKVLRVLKKLARGRI